MHACELNLCTDHHCSRRILAIAEGSSCLATSSPNALMGVDCRHPAPPRANPHSARGTNACHFPRFRSLKAFGRRTRCKPSQSAGIRNPQQTRRLRDVGSMSACHLIAAAADRGRRSGARECSPQKETPGASAPGAIPILEFWNSYPRRRIPSTQKRQRPHFFRPSSCLCGHLRNPAHSLRPVISIPHPKCPDQRVEREAQIAEIAGRP